MKQCGIYIIKNKINDKVYVGQSVDINFRWIQHKYSAKRTDKQDSYTQIHTAIRELGVENFYLEILEFCSYEKLSEREIYWIKKYNSYYNGYNMTEGGEGNPGESNGRALLKKAQVEDIRMAYNNHIPFRAVYEKYKDVISKRGLQKVWHYETWLNVMPEIYTEENRKWHATKSKACINGNKDIGYNNQERKCSEEEIKKMRELYSEGMNVTQIAKTLNRGRSTVRKYVLFQDPPNTGTIQVKNVETGLTFSSMKRASEWCNADYKTFKKYIDTENAIGIIPSTGEPAHWVKI